MCFSPPSCLKKKMCSDQPATVLKLPLWEHMLFAIHEPHKAGLHTRTFMFRNVNLSFIICVTIQFFHRLPTCLQSKLRFIDLIDVIAVPCWAYLLSKHVHVHRWIRHDTKIILHREEAGGRTGEIGVTRCNLATRRDLALATRPYMTHTPYTCIGIGC